MKRLVVLLAVAAALLAPAARVGAPARQLHDQPLQPDRGLRPPPLRRSTCSTWPRSRPSRPASIDAQRVRAPDRRERAPRPSTAGRSTLVPLRHGARPPARRRRPAHDAARGRAARAACSTARARIAYRDANYSDRIGWKEIVRRRAHARAAATSSARTRRTCCRARSTSTSATARARARRAAPTSPPALSTRQERSQAPDRVADSGFASLVGRYAPERCW